MRSCLAQMRRSSKLLNIFIVISRGVGRKASSFAFSVNIMRLGFLHNIFFIFSYTACHVEGEGSKCSKTFIPP